MSKHIGRMRDPVTVGKGRYVEVIPDLIAPDNLFRMSWRTPDSISPSSPRIIFPGVTRLVTHPSVASIASRTASKRALKSCSTWSWSSEERRLAHSAAAEPPTSTASGTTSWSRAADSSTRTNSGRCAIPDSAYSC